MKQLAIYLVIATLSAGCGSNRDPITIAVRAPKQFAIHRGAVDSRALRDFMMKRYKRNGPVPVILHTEHNLMHRDVRVPLDIGTSCGYWQYSVSSHTYTNPIPYPSLVSLENEWEWDTICDFETGVIATNLCVDILLTDSTMQFDKREATAADIAMLLRELTGTMRTNVLIRCNAYSSHDDLMTVLNACSSNSLHTVVISI